MSSEISRHVQGQVQPADLEILPPGQMRASDKERRRVIDHLIAQKHAGRIDNPAFEARTVAVNNAVTLKELDLVTVDLPALPAPRGLTPFHQMILRGALMITTFAGLIIGACLIFHFGDVWVNAGPCTASTAANYEACGWNLVQAFSSYVWAVAEILGGLALLAIQGMFWARWDASLRKD